MKLSTHGRYALRVMLDLAMHNDLRPVQRQEISTRQDISAEYIAQLFRNLCRDGLAQSVKGPGGGYVLGRDANQISIGDVIRSAEGPIAFVGCVLPNQEIFCARADQCPTRPIWVKLSKVVETYLDSISLQDIFQQNYPIDTQENPKCPESINNMIEKMLSFQDIICIEETK